MKKTTAATLFAALAMLSACETMEGLGRDTEKLGSNVEQSAKESDGNHADD